MSIYYLKQNIYWHFCNAEETRVCSAFAQNQKSYGDKWLQWLYIFSQNAECNTVKKK